MTGKLDKRVLEDRKKGLQKTKYHLKKMYNIQAVTAQEKRAIRADFKINGHYTKYKFCYKTHGAILFEGQNESRPGWFVKTTAEVFAYHMQEEKKLYLIDIKRTKEYINKNNPMKETKGALGNGWSWKISKSELYKNKLILKVIDLN